MENILYAYKRIYKAFGFQLTWMLFPNHIFSILIQCTWLTVHSICDSSIIICGIVYVLRNQLIKLSMAL